MKALDVRNHKSVFTWHLLSHNDHAHRPHPFLCGATARHYHPKVGIVGYQMKALGARNRAYTSLLHVTCRVTR